MDSVLTDSLEVLCDSELSDPRLFFTALDEVCQAGDNTDFEAFRTAFTERANRDGFTEPGELFVRHLADNGGADTVRKFADEGADNLVREYERLLSEPEPAGNPAAYDESVWVAFVAEFGASWNGAAETWDAFRTWFLYHAEERGVAAPATDFLDYAEGESDRVAFFARYGVTIDVAATDEAPAEEDPEVWQAFLAEYGPVWNGAEENWASFTPYFLHYAEERGVTGFAAACPTCGSASAPCGATSTPRPRSSGPRTSTPPRSRTGGSAWSNGTATTRTAHTSRESGNRPFGEHHAGYYLFLHKDGVTQEWARSQDNTGSGRGAKNTVASLTKPSDGVDLARL